MGGSETSSRADGHASVLIIGAGASGGMAAKRLAEEGISVVAIEQGYWQNPLNYRGSEWDWELTAAKQWSSRPDIRQNRVDCPIDLTSSDMAVLNFNGVGGGTIMYNAIWNRLFPSTFRERSQFGIADDWPIGWRRSRSVRVLVRPSIRFGSFRSVFATRPQS